MDGVLQVSAEQQKNQRALAALSSVAWAQGLVSMARRPRPQPGILFELRFAYEAHLRGLVPTRPFRAGVGGTDIDFRFPEALPWNVELVCVNEADAITAARRSSIEGGVKVEELRMGIPPDDDPDGEVLQPECDLRRMVSKLAEKFWRRDAPIKFPLSDGTAVNMLLVDVRSYLGGMGLIDCLDCWQMVFGPNGLCAEDVAWDDKSNQPLRGIWDPGNAAAYAPCARERVDVVGFVHEEAFEDDEIRQVTRLFLNPARQLDVTQNPLGWVGNRPPKVGLRATNPLWNLG